MIVNLRGPSGSGKTTAVRDFMRLAGPPVAIMGPVREGKRGPLPPKVEAYHLPGPNIYVMGSYENNCGGCDTIETSDEIERRVEKYAPQGHVLFEGMLVSHVYRRWYEFSGRMLEAGHEFVFASLDTPLELCIQRVYQRNGGKPYNEQNIIDKHRDNQVTARQFHDGGRRVVEVDHKRGPEALFFLFEIPWTA